MPRFPKPPYARAPELWGPLASLQALETPKAATHELSERLEQHGLPPSIPRWVGFVAYDATAPHRRHDATSPDPRHPAWYFARYDAMLVIDDEYRRSFIVADSINAGERLHALVSRQCAESVLRVSAPIEVRVPEPGAHAAAIDAALREIAEGNLYQVNLARRWRIRSQYSPWRLWRRLRDASPVPFGAYLNIGDFSILSRTMELFFCWSARTRVLQTRPIKGTIPLSSNVPLDNTPSKDRASYLELVRDDKERAEHTMIVDLMRNDLGRVAVPGTVHVADRMTVEPYTKLAHLVSTVSCRTREQITLANVFEALFPPGSVTGTPKIRAVRLIDELESCRRGVYTGCVGYVGHDGSATFAVAIRTAIQRGCTLDYFAGGGIVSASLVARELEETELKAEVLFDALRDFERHPLDEV